MEYKFSDRVQTLKPSAIREIFKYAADPSVVSLSAGNPSPDAFPAKEIAEISAKVLAENPISVLQYSVTEGYAPLRQHLMEYMKQKHNTGTDHMFFAVCLDDILIGYIAFNVRAGSHEIGYCFHSDYHGYGYAKESHMALFDYLSSLGITKFTAGTALNNLPSVSLLKSLRFSLTGTENVSFYKDAQGNDIMFEGGIFELCTIQ